MCGMRSSQMKRRHPHPQNFHALDELCLTFDLGKPIWLDATIREFKRHSKARFYQDSFIEEIEFDYLEIQVLEE